MHDAQIAQSELVGLGAPANAPIEFSVDFDATESEQCAIDHYFQGVDSVVGASRAGAYGDYYVLFRDVAGGCVSLAHSGDVNYLWQTYAWSGGQQGPMQLYQYANGAWNDTIDLDSIHGDAGLWLPDGSITSKGYAPPVPGSTPPPPPPPPSCGFGNSVWTITPWPNGDGGQSMTVHQVAGSVSCPQAEFAFGLQYVNKYTGQRTNVCSPTLGTCWDPFTSRPSDYWNLNYYVTPCSDGYRIYHFMVAIRSGSGPITAYKQVGSWALDSDCA